MITEGTESENELSEEEDEGLTSIVLWTPLFRSRLLGLAVRRPLKDESGTRQTMNNALRLLVRVWVLNRSADLRLHLSVSRRLQGRLDVDGSGVKLLHFLLLVLVLPAAVVRQGLSLCLREAWKRDDSHTLMRQVDKCVCYKSVKTTKSRTFSRTLRL